MNTAWQKEAVIYQIYPRSFQDSNGDGIGDLRGISQRLDYVKNLGVGVLWLSPCFASPGVDNGYDVSDYEAIHPDFGTMADFDELLEETHRRGLKLILDLVVNHSSDQHRWFQESRKSRDNPYRDYYVWRKPHLPALYSAEKGPEGEALPPNDWISFFSGPAWEFDPVTGEYYLHLFAKQQPDLNWENPALRQEIYTMMRLWLDKGVDGFRMDVIPFLSKNPAFPDYPAGRFGDLSLYANGPRIHEFLREMNREVLSNYDCLTVGEGFGVTAEQANLYVGRKRGELQMIYHFDHAVPREERHFLVPEPEFSLRQLKAIFNRWDSALSNSEDGGEGWQNSYFGNHDNPRMLSRFGDPVRFPVESATMLATVLLTLRGTPSLYQGDELGMSNCVFNSVDEFDDVQVRNAHQSLIVAGGGNERQFLAACNRIARDHARTPFPWDETPNAGFTTAVKPWLKLAPNFHEVNARSAQADPNSSLHFYRKLIYLRRQTPALVYGSYQDLAPDHESLYTFTRELEEDKLLIVCNFTGDDQDFSANPEAQLRLGNYAEGSQRIRPYEARIYRL